MAIDFPSTPSPGQNYDFGGVRYTWVDDGGSGYWAILEPGLQGPATGAEVTTGTDNQKYVTPLAVENSDIMKLWKLQANGGSTTNVDDAETVNFQQSGEINISRALNAITIGIDEATTSQKGTTQLYDDATTDGGTAKAGTARAVNAVYAIVIQKCKLNGARNGSTSIRWEFISQYTGPQCQIIIGRYTHTASSGANQVVTFAHDGFDVACIMAVPVVCQVVGSAGAHTIVLTGYPGAKTMTVRSSSHNSYGSTNFSAGYIALGY